MFVNSSVKRWIVNRWIVDCSLKMPANMKEKLWWLAEEQLE